MTSNNNEYRDDHEASSKRLNSSSPTVESQRNNPNEEVKDDGLRKTESNTSSDETQYPEGLRLALILVSICVAVFLVALDGTILATAIPTITSQFNSLDSYGWYNAAYLLTQSCFQLPYGRAYTLLSIKWTFLVSIFVFEVGTLICGVAPSSIVLIVGRAIAGLGGAGIFSGAQIIISQSAPINKRPLFTGLIGAMFGIASVTGPIIGGAFTTNVTWRWCFYINLPLGGLALIIAFFCLSGSQRVSDELKDKTWSERFVKFDPIGTVLILSSILCVLLALEWGGTTYSWNSGVIIALFVVFAVLLVAWIVSQLWAGDNAVVPQSIVVQRTVACSCLYTLFSVGAFSLIVFYIQLWFQAIRGNSAELSGIHNIPIVVSLVISSFAAGGLVVAIGYYVPFLIGGAICMAVGGALFMLLKPDSTVAYWIGSEILFAAGIGMSLEQCNIAVQNVLPQKKIPAGISLVVFMRGFAGSISVAVGQAVFSSSLQAGLKKNVPQLNPAIVSSSGATTLVKNIEMATNGNEAEVQEILKIYNHAVTRVFMVALILGAICLLPALGVEWKNVKKEKKNSKATKQLQSSQEEEQKDENVQSV